MYFYCHCFDTNFGCVHGNLDLFANESGVLELSIRNSFISSVLNIFLCCYLSTSTSLFGLRNKVGRFISGNTYSIYVRLLMCFMHDILIKNWKHVLRHAPKINVLNSINDDVFLKAVKFSSIGFHSECGVVCCSRNAVVSQVTLCMAVNYSTTVKLWGYVKCSSHFVVRSQTSNKFTVHLMQPTY
jgi:hypothetical protein